VNPPQNIDAGTWNTTGDAVSSTGYCAVSINSGSPHEFFHTITGDNPYQNNRFQLKNNQGDQLSFTLNAYQPSTTAWTPISPAQSKRIDKGLLDCSGSGQSPFGLQIHLTELELAAVPAGTYTETLHMLTGSLSSDPEYEVYDTITVSVIVPNVIQVNQLDDLNFGIYAGVGDLTLTEEFFVFATQGNHYNILLSDNSDNTGWALTHSNDPASSIPYELQASTTTFSPTFYTLTENVSHATFHASDNPNCVTGEKAFLRVNIKEADIVNKKNGTYTGTITVFVSTP
jgi:spore coat protein U-like protein